MTKVLEIRDIWQSYDQLEVLKGISFDVDEKEVKVVFGPSGSGKSTLLRVINMLTPPDKGEVLLRGESITAPGANLDCPTRTTESDGHRSQPSVPRCCAWLRAVA